MVPAATKAAQFISIGVHPLASTESHRAYFDVINNAFDASDFGSECVEPQHGDAGQHRLGLKDLSSRRKSVEHWPVFCINIQQKSSGGHVSQIERQVDDLQVDDRLLRLLHTLAVGWLEANHFKSRPLPVSSASRRSSRPNTPHQLPALLTKSASLVRSTGVKRILSSPITPYPKTQRTKSSPSQPYRQGFAAWSRIKSASEQHKQHMWDHVQATSRPNIAAELQMSTSSLPSEPANFARNPFRGDDDTRSDFFETKHPSAEALLAASKRTGTAYTSLETYSQPHRCSQEATLSSSNVSGYHRGVAHNAPLTGRSDWLGRVLKEWQNPLFAIQTEDSRKRQWLGQDDHYCTSKATDPFLRTVNNRNIRLTKPGLMSAEAVAQIDKKYILARMTQAETLSTTLLLLDQHAASERIILEGLLQQTFGVEEQSFVACSDESPGQSASKLQKPIHFSISEAEGETLTKQKSHFLQWAIKYDLTVSEESQDNTKLIVTHLPPTIAERCSLEPRLLIDLIRKEMYAYSTRSCKLIHTSDNTLRARNVDRHWLQRLHDAPRGLIELLNSRACRSAIMFNDKLSIAECQKLIDDLGRCAFPFICAHGRVSMVPLLNIDDDGQAGIGLQGLRSDVLDTADMADGSSFVDAYKDWQGM
ncbi:DNA mismatch repair protein MLH3 [Sphaceloma murrayae]|uniref:DNA mismatch repair protein MLH3 n=1 Tax=Sphaceloma murrayae TaxID=2082308 RepID=A0A2K1QHF9_9PEZI|nr:DNA mismatch repair protein MLH3 [Sphaceloma murrayae]